MSNPLMPGIASGASKRFRAGTHRWIAPAETLERVRPFFPVLGITRVANVTGLDFVGIPVVMVCRPNSRSLAVSQGKGLDLDAAKASGVMEAVELYHAERITLPVKLASAHELWPTHELVDVAALPRLSVSAYHDDLRLLWIEGHDLLRNVPVWLPYETVHMNCTLPFPSGSGCFHLSSNGLASGNHPLEALSHAICEVLERDAYSVWQAAGESVARRTRVDLGTVDDPDCRGLLELYDQAGLGVGVWDMTSDVGVAAFRCVILERRLDLTRLRSPSAGMGCHPVREVALSRALTEAAQSRLTLISGARDDMGRDRYAATRNPEVLERIRSQLTTGESPRSYQDVPTRDSERFEDDVRFLLERLQTAGVESVVAVDLTHPALGLPVVRVVIPGLEGSIQDVGYVAGPRARAAAAGAR